MAKRKSGREGLMLKIFIIILIILLAAFLIDAIYKLVKENGTTSGAECTQNSDCVKKQVSCCPCNSGGKEICIAKTNSSYDKVLGKCPLPGELVCAQVYNCKVGSCGCVDGKCMETG